MMRELWKAVIWLCPINIAELDRPREYVYINGRHIDRYARENVSNFIFNIFGEKVCGDAY